MPKFVQPRNEELPPDNGARLAIFDALAGAVGDPPVASAGLTPDELTDCVIGRLRVLVPQIGLPMHEQPQLQQGRQDLLPCQQLPKPE